MKSTLAWVEETITRLQSAPQANMEHQILFKVLQDLKQDALMTPAPARLARLILDLTADALSGDQHACGHGGAYDTLVIRKNPRRNGAEQLMPAMQEDLADRVGVSRAYACTLLNEWKRKGILRHNGRTLCVLDLKALRKLAG